MSNLKLSLPSDATLSAGAAVFVIALGGGAVGAFAMWWAKGQGTELSGALVGLIGTAVAVLGWYRSNQLHADAQRIHLLHQLLNEARLTVVSSVRLEQDRLRMPSLTLLHIEVSSSLAPDDRTRCIFELDKALNAESTRWIFVLEEHRALFPETERCRRQLVDRATTLYQELRAFRERLAMPGPLGPQIHNAAAELQTHVSDQSALLEDVCVHVQNRALGAVSGVVVPPRRPPDPRRPRLERRPDGQLEIRVPDAAERAQMIVSKWLNPHVEDDD